MNDLAGVVNFMNPTGTTNGYVLTADSTVGGKVKWAAGGGGGGGKLIQVVSGTYSTATTTTSTSYVDTGLSLSITPTLSTSKILVMTTQNIQVTHTSGGSTAGVQVLRGATSIFAMSDYRALEMFVGGSPTTEYGSINSIQYIDSPATTSATTYKVQFKAGFSGDSLTAQPGSNTSSIILMEIGA
jgi:hypothetical protein